jgi:hypothetical protein
VIRDEAVELLRTPIDSVPVTPTTKNGLEVKVKGEIGRMTNLAEGKPSKINVR